MKNILVFAGTTEGREVTECLSRNGISCHVCVATEYGNQMLKPDDNVTVHSGRLDEEGMRSLYKEIGCSIVVDATHPYAKIVTDTIKASIEGTDISYIRLLRKNDATAEGSNIFLYESIEACAASLMKTDGNILLTTGSKQLKEFTSNVSLRKRIIARVLPGIESINICYEAGLEGKQIIAMQGPFSKEMNEVTIKQYEIKHLVTKESGVTGGVDSKLAAAEELGIDVHIIKRPGCEEDYGLDFAGTIARLENELGRSLSKGGVNVSLVGIGPGSRELLTKEAENAITGADYIFGAQRMLDSVESNAAKYPYYLKRDILPILSDLSKNSYNTINAVILFSGDSGFYSGSENMYAALKNETDYNVKVLPGISSVSILAARIGIGWQDGRLISTHGVAEEIWAPRLIESVKYNRKTFFITSGQGDIHRIGELLKEKIDCNYEIYIGYNLTYEDEKVLNLTADECMSLESEGLYAGVVISQSCERRILVPDMRDEDFERGKVPMTKESVRKLSICKMRIKEGDVVYDIGGGTGSIAVQAAALSPSVKVFTLEFKSEACDLIRINAAKNNLTNITVLECEAPEGLDGLPIADVCFIGGSNGNLKQILECLYEINPYMRVVMNAVCMENICEMNRLLSEMKVTNLSIEQVAISDVKELGKYHLMNANNPVFVFAFDFTV